MSNTNNLFVSEKFYSIQGEGVSTGVPAIFLRLSGCNILCKSKNWICDSIEVWQKGVKTPFEDVFTAQEIELLVEGVHLVITGGEPLLHQKKLIEFLMWFQARYGFMPFIEVETNGTILPNVYLFLNVDQWNCSPKLSNSGEKLERRLKKDVILNLASAGAWFKFVVANEDDVLEIFDSYNFIDKNKILLMPAGDSQDLLNDTRPKILDLCKKYILRFTDRTHIVAWNKKTGV